MGYRFNRGERFIRAEREYVIEERLSNGRLKFRDVATNEYMTRHKDELINELFEGNLKMISDNNNNSYIRKKAADILSSDFTQLPEKLRNEAKKRYAYIMEIIRQGLDNRTKETIDPIIDIVSKEINDPKPPNWISVYRWLRDFIASGENIRSLISAHSKKGNHNSKISLDIEKVNTINKIIENSINEIYLNQQRKPVQAVYNNVVVRIDDENRFREPHDKLTIPHKSTIYRAVKKVDQYELTEARYGKRIAHYKFRTIKHVIKPSRPLGRVEIDHTKLDLIVIDPVTRLPFGRPWLTTAIDICTKSVVGIYLSFDPPSYLSVMLCLIHAITPKTYVKGKYPNIEYSWDAYGIIETLVVDNGKEFHSTHLEDACLQLGILIQYAPPKYAWYKGGVERYFGTFNIQLLHQQPGTTFANILDKADYEPKKNAIISIDILLEIIHKWIIDIYHQQEHRGIKNTPARAWKAAIEGFPPALPPNKSELEVLLGMIVERTVSAKGIELFGLFYNCDELLSLRQSQKKEKVKIKYDPTDISVIHVFDRFKRVFIPIPALDQSYTNNLSLWQHKVILNYARQRVKKHVDIIALARAKEEINKIVSAEWNNIKKNSTGQKIARYKKDGQQQHKDLLNYEQKNNDLKDNAIQLNPSNNISHMKGYGHNLKDISNFRECDAVHEHKEIEISKNDDKHETSTTSEKGDDDIPDKPGWSADYNLPK